MAVLEREGWLLMAIATEVEKGKRVNVCGGIKQNRHPP